MYWLFLVDVKSVSSQVHIGVIQSRCSSSHDPLMFDNHNTSTTLFVFIFNSIYLLSSKQIKKNGLNTMEK